MGITGLYAELGPGERISLAKLADDHLTSTGQPLRLAIDVSIWSFQAQAAQGGTNPALRTLYYRLVRLLSLPILPIFVFDGPSRPAFKRNQRTGNTPAYITSRQKRLISLFGYPHHTAPGEAEAECAHLQKLGIVDATLSEDVDTLMFGCRRVLRNWSTEKGTTGAPTHVTLYDLEKVEKERGLDPEGMIMVALMSGGDYIPAGVPGCGIRTAADAARAGFGRELCALGAEGDEEGLRCWREKFTHELRTNQSKLFSRKNSKIEIPESFPHRQVLGYYLTPVVSGLGAEIVTRGPKWDGEVDWRGLREFVREVFEWSGKEGAKKMMRTLAGGLLVGRLLKGTVNRKKEDEGVQELVQKISGRRVHHSTDGLPELRVAYTPASVVPIDLDAEPDDDRDTAGLDAEEDDSGSADEQRKGAGRKPRDYDPFAVERMWVSEHILRLGARDAVEQWEEGLDRPKKKKAASKAAAAPAPKKGRAKAAEKDSGAMEKYMKASKPSTAAPALKPAKGGDAHGAEGPHSPPLLPRRNTAPKSPPRVDPQAKPPRADAPRTASTSARLRKPSTANLKAPAAAVKPVSKPRSKAPPTSAAPAPAPATTKADNPWTLAAKRPPAPTRTNTEGLIGATTTSRATQSKSEVKSRSVSEYILSSPLPPIERKASRIRSKSPPSPLLISDAWRDPLKYIENCSPVELSDLAEPTRDRVHERKAASRPKSSSPSPTAAKYFPPDEPPSPDWIPPLHLHGEKRHRKQSPPIEVIDLLSPYSAVAFDNSPTTTTKWASKPTQKPQSSELGTPSRRLKSSEHGESPSKKIKTPESARRASTVHENEADLFNTPSSVIHTSPKRLSGGFHISDEESSFDYNDCYKTPGYDDHFGYYDQDTSPASLRDSFDARNEAIGNVNRVLDFSAPPPPEEPYERELFLSEQLSFLPALDTNLALSSSAYSINNSTPSSTLSSAYSDYSIPLSTPTTESQPVRDFSWITTTRGNFSPRKQLKRVMEGVFPSSSPLSAKDDSESPPQLFQAAAKHKRAVASDLSPVEALQEIMQAPSGCGPPSPLKELQHPLWDDQPSSSRASSRASDESGSRSGSASSCICLGPGFDERASSAPVVPDQKTPPPRRMRSMIPVPSAKKSKTPAPAPAPAPVTIKPRAQAQKQPEKPPPQPQPHPKQSKKAGSGSAPPPAEAPRKISVRQSIESGMWRELGEFGAGAMQTVGRKGGLAVKKSMGKMKVWEDVEVVDLTGE